MALDGAAKSEINIVDLSVIVGTGPRGIIGLVGPTTWGELNKPILVGSPEEYRLQFGPDVAGSDFGLEVLRLLQRGGRCRISRVAHYSDPADTSTLEGTKATGVIGTGGNVTTATAKSIGAWGNAVKVTTSAAASGNTALMDILVQNGTLYSETLRDVKRTPTADDIVTLNNRSRWVDFAQTGTAVNGTVTLATGAQVYANIVDADYVGSATTATGMRAYDAINDIVKIAVPHLSSTTIDDALCAYADLRQDILAATRFPVGITDAGAVSYRERTSPYSGTAPTTWRGHGIYGGLVVADPKTNNRRELGGLGDYLGLSSKKDNVANPWTPVGGYDYGRIPAASDVVYNLGTPARQANLDLVDFRGIIPLINDSDYGPIIWGNKTFYKSPDGGGSLLQNLEVAELLVYLVRILRPIIKSVTFKPNDINTWKNIYRRVVPVMNYVKDNGGVYDWIYQGDQEIDIITQAQINNPNDVTAGRYKFNLFVQPVPAMKYIQCNLVVTNAGVTLEEVSEALLTL